MFMKKLARSAATSSVNSSLKQKSKISFGKVKHLGDKADLSFKLPISEPGWYKNIDTSSEKKLEYELGKDLDYSTGSKSNRLLNSCTNTPKTKRFNSDAVKILSLEPCDFGSAVNDVDMDLPPSVLLESPLHSVTSVKERFCFKPTKSFALDIGLSAIPGNTLYNKLKGVRKLFYKVDGFGSASTPSKFPGIVKTSFISESSFTLAKQLAVSKNLLVNTDLKKIGIQSNQEIVIKEIPANLPKLAIESALVKYGKNFSIKIQLIGLWQKVLVKFESSQVADLVMSKWSILLGKNSVQIVKANTDKQTWDLRDSYCTLLYTLLMGTTKTCCISRNLVSYAQAQCAVICFDSKKARKAVICSMLVFKGINLVWDGLLSPKCATCGNFGHVSSGCNSGEKIFKLDFKKRFLCSNLDKKCLVLIYAKKQALVSCPVFFGGATWASVISGSPKNLSSIPFVGTNTNIKPVGSSMPKIAILASHVSVFECLFENVSDQIADISHKLDRLLAVLSASFVVSPTPEHNPVLDMAVDALLVTQDIFPSGSQVLTAKVGGLEASLLVLENSIKTIMNKLDSFGSGNGIVLHSLPQ
ncbi:hypothetical protein G9A89_015968 [Geosiphon pyriformis]|nr:hypothetical protein G9A89_015968 [Geosiphon pyriformis]